MVFHVRDMLIWIVISMNRDISDSSSAARQPPRVTLSLHDALPISSAADRAGRPSGPAPHHPLCARAPRRGPRSEEHTSELQSRGHIVCRLLLEKKKWIDRPCQTRTAPV